MSNEEIVMRTSKKDWVEIGRNLGWCSGLVILSVIYMAPEKTDPIRILIQEDQKYGTPPADAYLQLMESIRQAEEVGQISMPQN